MNLGNSRTEEHMQGTCIVVTAEMGGHQKKTPKQERYD